LESDFSLHSFDYLDFCCDCCDFGCDFCCCGCYSGFFWETCLFSGDLPSLVLFLGMDFSFWEIVKNWRNERKNEKMKASGIWILILILIEENDFVRSFSGEKLVFWGRLEQKNLKKNFRDW